MKQLAVTFVWSIPRNGANKLAPLSHDSVDWQIPASAVGDTSAFAEEKECVTLHRLRCHCCCFKCGPGSTQRFSAWTTDRRKCWPDIVPPLMLEWFSSKNKKNGVGLLSPLPGLRRSLGYFGKAPWLLLTRSCCVLSKPAEWFLIPPFFFFLDDRAFFPSLLFAHTHARKDDLAKNEYRPVSSDRNR